jgi:hypothetical protein
MNFDLPAIAPEKAGELTLVNAGRAFRWNGVFDWTWLYLPIGTAIITIMAVLFIMAMLWINVNPGLLRKGGILGCWRPPVFRRMNIYGDGSLENLIVVVIAGVPNPLKIAESFRPNR